jgi:hypothetical protein
MPWRAKIAGLVYGFVNPGGIAGIAPPEGGFAYFEKLIWSCLDRPMRIISDKAS